MADVINFRVKNGLLVTTTATVEGTTQATSTTTGALIVAGGAGIARDLFVGGLANIAGATTITNTTNASSTVTGALQVRGGAGVGGNLYIGGDLNVTGSISGTLAGNAATVSAVRQPTNGTYYPAFVDSNNASATAEAVYTTSSFSINPSTGVITAGIFSAANNGNGTNFQVGDDTWIGDINVANTLRITGQQNTGNAYIVFGTSDTASLGRAGTGPLTYSSSFAVSGATQATSTITGAFTVTGGAGIGGNLYVGGTIFGTIGAAVTTATNIAGGGPGMVVYQSGVATTAFVATGTAGTLLISNGTSAPTFNNTLTLDSITEATSTSTGALQVRGGVGVNRDVWIGQRLNVGSDAIITGNAFVNGGTFGTSQTTFNLVNTTATTVNFAGAGTLVTIGASATGSTTVRNKFTVTDTTNATSTVTGAVSVRGGASIGQDVFIGGAVDILGTAASTSSITTNALYVAGGVGIGSSLYVQGKAYFQDDVIFSGTSTYVYSTQTLYTDNLINLHVPAGASGTNHTWTVDDGRDVGHIYHYYTGTDRDAFLGLATGSKFLEWWSNGTESNGLYTGSTWGTFKTGSVILTNTTESTTTATGALTVAGGVGIGNNVLVGGYGRFNGAFDEAASTTTVALYVGVAGSAPVSPRVAFANSGTTWQIDNYNGNFRWYTPGVTRMQLDGNGTLTVPSTTASISTTSGALQVSGGVGIGGSVYVGGNLTVLGTINATVVGIITTATNLAGGTAGRVPYQTGIGLTSFTAAGTAGTILTSNGTGAPTWNNTLTLDGTTQATSTVTGALTVAGGAGIRGNLWLGGTLNFFPEASDFASISSTASGSNTFFNFNLGDDPGQSDTWRWRFFPSGANEFSAMELDVTSTTTAILTVSGDIAAATIVASGDVSVNGGDLQTNQTTFNLINTTATTVNFGGASTAMTVGANAAGYVLVQNNSDATSTATGALRVNGGVGVNRDVWVGQRLNVGSDAIITGDVSVNGGDLLTNQTTFNLLNTTATTINFGGAGTAITIGATTGATTLRNDTTVTSITAATTTATGALQVRGGAGIGGSLYVGGNNNVAGNEIITGDVSINGGDLQTNQTTFNLINTTATTINFGGAGTAITIGATTGNTTIRNDTTITSITAASSTSTGALQVRGGVGIGGDLYVGGTINGTASTAGNANSIRTTATTTASSYYLTFVDSNNSVAAYESLYTGVGITFNPSNSDLVLAGDLQVQGGDLTTNQTTFNLLNSTATTINFGGASTAMTVGANAAGTVTIRNNTDATSTATGGLVVYGGVGVNRSVFIGGNNNVAGNEIVTGDVSINGGDLQTNQTTFNLINTTATTINFGGASTVMNVGAAGAGYVQIKNNSSAGSTATGALRVDGGVGVNGAVYAGNIFTNGSQVIPFKMEEFTATASQTTFTVTGGYTVGTVMVFANGIFLNSGDFTASNGTTVVLTFARTAGDVIKVIAGGTSSAANQSQSFSIAMSVAMSM